MATFEEERNLLINKIREEHESEVCSVFNQIKFYNEVEHANTHLYLKYNEKCPIVGIYSIKNKTFTIMARD